MRSNWMNTALSMVIAVGLHIFPATAQADSLKGKLVELSSVENRVTLQPEGGADNSVVSYRVSGDARWHICLKDSCLIRKGVEGFKAVNEYAEYGAYGIPHKTYDVTLELKDNVAMALEVQLVPKVH